MLLILFITGAYRGLSTMDYLFENLGDERFQEFCSCLINKKFPFTQSFPVGQPDGGRDSVVYLMDKPIKEFYVFQVKFVRNANTERDVSKWFINMINGEIDKINRLIPNGATKYFILTNVRSSGHLESGTIDKTNKILESKIKIPSICWWREDLARIFEMDPAFKWSFPELLNGQELLNLGLFNHINDNRERREGVIRAYLSDQYDIDNEVKFKQIDLQNGLYNLFIDVPIKAKNMEGNFNPLFSTLETALSRKQYRRLMSYNNSYYDFDSDVDIMGAAQFLLNSVVQEKINSILLEGGPGQGKSTISQYVCQVHRSRLLNKSSDLELIPNNIKNAPIRLPFKIDLRHVANWIENKNPYNDSISDEYYKRTWQKSLESFLVCHIFYHSGIEDFSINDFISISKISPVLFVFDGFDEIANLEARKEVIEFINKGLGRISINSKSIQVIITSRPAALTENVSFSEEMYPHFELRDITPSIIDDYVNKWIKASRLNGKEASEIRRLFKDKMGLSHLRELTKTPMQLAILLSLLKTEGESLPNKRTALYDNYIRLFFNRESEKNITIRKYRDLIIDIHEYLAWVLHSEAELYNNNGTINIEDLKARLNYQLQKEGHLTEITDLLFQAVKERVCALVSRVQGTFEFEIQPLREYFCAKYLYKTKPYSPSGSNKSGTLPDRFDAISRNFYWQNVVRFFAGCFDKGELSMLIQKLKELLEDINLKYTNYPRILTSQLLADYVFTQYPLLLKDVVRIIINGVDIGSIINQYEGRSSNDKIILPLECGRVELIDECFNQLKTFPIDDYANEIIELVKNNPDDVLNRWNSYAQNLKGSDLTQWLQYGYRMGIIHILDDKYLVEILEENSEEREKRLEIIINGNRIEFINKHIEYKSIALKAVLSGNSMILPKSSKMCSLEYLTLAVSPVIICSMFESAYTGPYKNNLRRVLATDIPILDFEITDEIDERIKSFSELIAPIFIANIDNWRTSLNQWNLLVESGFLSFGHNWTFYIISVLSAGIKSVNEKYQEFEDLGNISLPLCKRTRYARLKSGNTKYWENQLNSKEEFLLKLLVLFTWATSRTIIRLKDTITPLIESLNDYDFIKLANSLNITTQISKFSRENKNEICTAITNDHIQDKFIYLLSLRLNNDDKLKFVYTYVSDISSLDNEIGKIKLMYMIELYFTNTSNEMILSKIREAYCKLKNINYKSYRRYSNQYKDLSIPFNIAKKIMIECKEYPNSIVNLAERACRNYASEVAIPVGEIAANEKWFDNN